jgi:ribosomal protein S17E
MSSHPLSPLPVKKTVVFYSPFEGDDVLVRTGIIEGQENTMIHAILHAYSKDYSSVDTKRKIKMAKSFGKNPREVLEKFYNAITNDITDNKLLKKLITKEADKEVYKIIFGLITVPQINQRIFNNSEDPEKIALELFKGIGKEKEGYCSRKFTELIKACLKNTVNRDIFIFDSRTRIPSKSLDTKKRKTILLMCFPDEHYEVIGRLLPGNKVQRVFNHDDPLIKRVSLFLKDPDTFAKEYPSIIREIIPESSSRSESERSSSRNSRSSSHRSHTSSSSRSSSQSESSHSSHRRHRRSRSSSSSHSSERVFGNR